MRDLNYALKQLCRRNRDGSYATQADREHILDLIADQLHEMGFRHMNAHSLKPKHVEKLVERWLAEKLSPGTIKNRMSALRWWAKRSARKTSSPGPTPLTASRIGSTSPTIPKQRNSVMDSSTNPDTLHPISLRLQAAFGLRARSRSRSFRRGRIAEIASCSRIRGPRAGEQREIPIRTLEQRQLIDEAKALAKGKSLVAPGYHHVPRLSQVLPLRVRASRHSRLPRPSAFLRPGALRGIDWLGVPGARRAKSKQLTHETEGGRSRGPGSHQPRDGSRSRTGHGGLPG